MTIEWKKLDNFDNYLFSNNGEIINIKTKKYIKGSTHDDGYLRTNLRNNQHTKMQMFIHKVIAALFVENKDNYKFIKHIDDNKSNNNYKNL